jgi:hypothetical protein
MSDLGTLGFPGAAGEDHLLRQIADLRRAQRELGPSIAKSFTGTAAALQESIDRLVATQAALADVLAAQHDAVETVARQQAYLESLVSRDTSLDVFNSGPVPPDSAYRWVGDTLVVSGVVCTTGKLRVSTFVDHLTVSGDGVIAAGLTYAVDGVHTLSAGARACSLYSANARIGSALARVGHVTVPPGTEVTVRARAFTWAAAGNPSANFERPRLVVEVVNSD